MKGRILRGGYTRVASIDRHKRR